jgi:hypothetical protein
MHRFAAAIFLSSLLGTAMAASDATPATAPADSGTATAPTPATAPAAASTPAPATDTAADTTTEPGTQIYMVTRIKLNGTDLTQVVFFRHNAITTMEACEAERNAGMTSGWNYFSRYYLKTLKGVSYGVDYRCVEGEQNMSVWRSGVPQDNFYLVRTTDNKLKVQAYKNFFACRDALGRRKEETIDAFCALSSQVVKPKVTEAASR